MAPGERYDQPFGGPPAGATSDTTNRIMAFDAVKEFGFYDPNQADDFNIDDYNAKLRQYGHALVKGQVKCIRHVGLFERNDDKGRLQPLLGTAEPATDYFGNPVNWPDSPVYKDEAHLEGQVEGTVAFRTESSTENPEKNEVEICNVSADDYPIHFHLVDFEVKLDPDRDEDNICRENPTGVCLQE